MLEYFVVVVPSFEFRIEDFFPGIADHGLGHGVQLLRLRVRQGTQEDGVEGGENGGVGSDAESEREDRDGGEPAVSAQAAKGYRQVLDKLLQDEKGPSVPAGFFGLGEVAHLALRSDSGSVGRESGGFVFLLFHGTVKLEFFG